MIERGRKAVELLFELKQFIPLFVQNHNIPKSQGKFPSILVAVFSPSSDSVEAVLSPTDGLSRAAVY